MNASLDADLEAGDRAIGAMLDDLVCGFHVLDLDGQGAGLAGHLTARRPGERVMWGHRFGLFFGEVTRRTLVQADFDLRTLTGEGRVNPTLHIHTEIYRARPDVNAVLHTHGANCAALTALGAGLAPCSQIATIFFEDCGFLDEYEGVATDRSEGQAIARTLGSKRAVLLANHGQLVVGKSVGEAVYLAVALERAAGIQLAAMQVGTVKRIPDDAARRAKGFFDEANIELQWQALRREAQRLRPQIFDA